MVGMNNQLFIVTALGYFRVERKWACHAREMCWFFAASLIVPTFIFCENLKYYSMLRRSRNLSVRWIVSWIIQCNIKFEMLMCSSSTGHDSIFLIIIITQATKQHLGSVSMNECNQTREVTLHIIRELRKLWRAWLQNDDLPNTNCDLHINLCMCPTNDDLKGWMVRWARPPNSMTRLHSSLVKAHLCCSLLLWHPNPDPIMGLGMC